MRLDREQRGLAAAVGDTVMIEVVDEVAVTLARDNPEPGWSGHGGLPEHQVKCEVVDQKTTKVINCEGKETWCKALATNSHFDD
jgi:hypothetical protein